MNRYSYDENVVKYIYISINDIEKVFGNPDRNTMINILNVDEEDGYVDYTYKLIYNHENFLLKGRVKYGRNDDNFDFFITGGTPEERAQLSLYCRTYASERQVEKVLQIMDKELMKAMLSETEYSPEKVLDNKVLNDILENYDEQR